jgi:hypothetical protein
MLNSVYRAGVYNICCKRFGQHKSYTTLKTCSLELLEGILNFMWPGASCCLYKLAEAQLKQTLVSINPTEKQCREMSEDSGYSSWFF